jgi:Ca2+-binding EF-hand superfamily protein
MKTTTSLLAITVLIGSSCFATAQEKPKRPERPIAAEILKKFDKDADGKLSEEERAAMKEDRKQMKGKPSDEILKKFDKDADGKLSDEEKATMKTEMEAKRKMLFEKYDANKNGKLDPEEAAAARAAGEEIPPPPRGHGGKGKGKKDGPPAMDGDKPEAPPAE